MNRTCPECQHPVAEGDRFCAVCGTPIESAAATSTETTVRRRALGMPQPPDLPPPVHEVTGIHPLPNMPEPVRKRRRKRRKRPLYRRPLVMVPLVLLVLVVSGAAVVAYRVESLMTSVHAISTPPPMITDATYMEEDDPDMPAQPISVDTGPAREVLSSVENDVVASDAGFGARLRQAASNSGDLIGGAAVAAGLKNQGGDPLTILVMGVDARPGAAIDIGVRPDVLMLVRLDPQTRSCRVLAIPRDTRVELPGYGKSKINHALMVGGIPYQLLVTESFLDIEIDHYMLIDFVAFEYLVDAVGGISVDVPEDLVKNGEVRFTEGTQIMTGEEALAYTRFRSSEDGGDVGRVERRWDLLSGLADSVQGRDLVGDANTMIPALRDHFRTDLGATDITQIAKDYGTGCTSPAARSSENIDTLEGTRVRFVDPILNQSLYYNVIDAGAVSRSMDAFLGPIAASSPATPVSSPVPSPVPSDTATPRAQNADGRRRLART